MSLKQYSQVYQNFVATSVTEAFAFRLNFLMVVIVDIFFMASSLGATYVLFEHTTHLGPWTREHLLFFICFMLAIDDWQNLIITNNFWMLSADLREGNLDFTFLKPVKSLFPLFFRYLRIPSILSVLITGVALWWYGKQLNFVMIQWLLLPLMLLLGLALRSLIEMSIALLMFWTTEGTGINFIRLQLQSVSRWPNFIYKGIARKLLSTVLPVLLIGSAPLHFLFELNQWEQLLLLILMCLVFMLLVRTMWDFAKRRYESASS